MERLQLYASAFMHGFLSNVSSSLFSAARHNDDGGWSIRNYAKPNGNAILLNDLLNEF